MDTISILGCGNYWPGTCRKGYDKQFVRDFLTSTRWDKTPPPPELPEDVINGTSEKYGEALIKLTHE